MNSKTIGRGSRVEIIVLGLIMALFLLPAASASAQSHVDTYYLKIESLPIGRKVTYLDSTKIYSSEPKQFIAEKDIDGVSSIYHDAHKDSLFSIVRGGLVNINAPRLIRSAKITDASGSSIVEKEGINDQTFSVDISIIKNGFYTLEIVYSN